MAKYNVVGIEELADDFNRMKAMATDLVPKMLEAAAEVYVKAQQREAEKLKISGRSRGALVRSIKQTKVKTQGGSKCVEIYPHGTDKNHTKKGVRNAEKGFVLHYGNSNMPGIPWMETANTKCEAEGHEAQKRIWMEGMK